MKKIYIVNLSGGKDSTAMLFKLLEMNSTIDYIVFCDTGVEFPEVYEHINKVNLYLRKWNKSITILKPKYNFIEYMTKYKRKKSKYRELPYFFPSYNCRWCTGELKLYPLLKFKKDIKNRLKDEVVFINYVGFTIDEYKRANRLKLKETNHQKYRFPLIEAKMNEKQALFYCYSKKFNWSYLYNYIDRASCYTCPFSKKKKLKYIINYRPKLWQKIKFLENNLKSLGIKSWKFLPDQSTEELEKKLKNKNEGSIITF